MKRIKPSDPPNLLPTLTAEALDRVLSYVKINDNLNFRQACKLFEHSGVDRVRQFCCPLDEIDPTLGVFRFADTVGVRIDKLDHVVVETVLTKLSKKSFGLVDSKPRKLLLDIKLEKKSIGQLEADCLAKIISSQEVVIYALDLSDNDLGHQLSEPGSIVAPTAQRDDYAVAAIFKAIIDRYPATHTHRLALNLSNSRLHMNNLESIIKLIERSSVHVLDLSDNLFFINADFTQNLLHSYPLEPHTMLSRLIGSGVSLAEASDSNENPRLRALDVSRTGLIFGNNLDLPDHSMNPGEEEPQNDNMAFPINLHSFCANQLQILSLNGMYAYGSLSFEIYSALVSGLEKGSQSIDVYVHELRLLVQGFQANPIDMSLFREFANPIVQAIQSHVDVRDAEKKKVVRDLYKRMYGDDQESFSAVRHLIIEKINQIIAYVKSRHTLMHQDIVSLISEPNLRSDELSLAARLAEHTHLNTVSMNHLALEPFQEGNQSRNLLFLRALSATFANNINTTLENLHFEGNPLGDNTDGLLSCLKRFSDETSVRNIYLAGTIDAQHPIVQQAIPTLRADLTLHFEPAASFWKTASRDLAAFDA
ncbi:MAG: hypothetical protein ACK5NY_03340 [Burkholderiaceae bacterium]|jgi:hypothetical protein